MSQIRTLAGHEVAVGADGAVRQESDAVPQRGAVRGCRGRWKSKALREMTIGGKDVYCTSYGFHVL